jgi:hypothetical protein
MCGSNKSKKIMLTLCIANKKLHENLKHQKLTMLVCAAYELQNSTQVMVELAETTTLLSYI